ncbi:hypothetical protein [uncultured Cellulomonas sp.]|uniref:hypothetical protein n=1 Tax=uncultured Cellulomonas sp. TaxID=189682 RepID=UPI0028E3A2F4|nr:hypothetical protein [uncultured Cellulomonas sp.]
MTTIERSAALWLRAYPRRWRVDRTAEVTELLTDLAPAGATRIDLRTAVGLVRAGWAARWRGRPPVWAFLVYRLTDRRPSARYDAWLRDDLDGVLYPVRVASTLLLVPGPALLTLSLALDGPMWPSAVALAFVYGGTVAEHARGRAAKREVLFGAPAEIGPMGPYRGLDR